MSAEAVLSTVGTDLKGFWTKLSADVAKAKAVWALIQSQQVRALATKITADVIVLVKDTTADVAAKGLNLQLDEQTFTDVKALIADAKSGNGVIVTDLKALGITL